MTKASGISGCMAAAGLTGAAEINSSWATGGTENPEEHTKHSGFTTTKFEVKKERLSGVT